LPNECHQEGEYPAEGCRKDQGTGKRNQSRPEEKVDPGSSCVLENESGCQEADDKQSDHDGLG
jgi:hypothetical protein